MEYIAVSIAALLASGLTLFSGFGLGTLLMPVFALFFPLELAVAMTAAVHFLNNLFKLALVGRHADNEVVLRFGLPAIAAAAAGAGLLLLLTGSEPLFTYWLGDRQFFITPLKLTIAAIVLAVSAAEALPSFDKLQFDRKYLPLGGALSGFLGGLSGLQGALRSAFLVKCGLEKTAFVASGAVIAAIVDITRLAVYLPHFTSAGLAEQWRLVALAVLAAFLGAFIGARLVKKVTMRSVQLLVTIMLCLVSLALGAGLI
jgi:uncharacterized protein